MLCAVLGIGTRQTKFMALMGYLGELAGPDGVWQVVGRVCVWDESSESHPLLVFSDFSLFLMSLNGCQPLSGRQSSPPSWAC